MFVRLLFLLLLALNAGVGMWLVFGDGMAIAQPLPTAPGVPELHLLSEQAGDIDTLAGSMRKHNATPGTRHADDRCLHIGPFNTQSDTRNAINALSAHVRTIQYRKEPTTQSAGWWVFLPPLATRDQALNMARRLSAKGVSDYYVVTAGDRQNTISLGLFHDPDNARRRQQALVNLGFPAQRKERTETLPEYWVDIALPKASNFDWHASLHRADVSAQPINCF